MTREDFCKRCSRYAGCGFISRNLQAKCDILQIFEEGYEQGYEDAISKACDWLRAELDKEEELHYIHVHGFDKERREIFLEELKKAMKGE